MLVLLLRLCYHLHAIMGMSQVSQGQDQQLSFLVPTNMPFGGVHVPDASLWISVINDRSAWEPPSTRPLPQTKPIMKRHAPSRPLGFWSNLSGAMIGRTSRNPSITLELHQRHMGVRALFAPICAFDGMQVKVRRGQGQYYTMCTYLHMIWGEKEKKKKTRKEKKTVRGRTGGDMEWKRREHGRPLWPPKGIGTLRRTW